MKFRCMMCRKKFVKYDGGLCYGCWHQVNFARVASVEPLGQLDLFFDGEVEKRELTSS